MVNNIGSLSVLRRWICRSRAVGIMRAPYPSDYNSAGNLRSLNSTATNRGVSSNKSRPWMMLQPVIECGDGDAELVGYSHGWAALFDKRNGTLFLSNPLSHRIIKLPAIHTIPVPRRFNLDLDGHRMVSKVILSSSPEECDCRAMMTFGPANSLACCSPGHSGEWTPIGDPFFNRDHKDPFLVLARVHEDLVYCSRRKVFTAVTAGNLDLRSFVCEDDCDFYMDHFRDVAPERYDWDIQDLSSPKLVRSEQLYGKKNMGMKTQRWVEKNFDLLENECIQIPHVVYAEQWDRLYLVIRFVRLMKEEDGSPLGYIPSCEVNGGLGLGLSAVFPAKTYGFIVLGMNDENEYCCDERICTVEEDLDGMAMFVGINHSFAVSAAASASASDDQLIMPNSIYFSDAKRILGVCGVNDNGIFDCATKTITWATTW